MLRVYLGISWLHERSHILRGRSQISRIDVWRSVRTVHVFCSCCLFKNAINGVREWNNSCLRLYSPFLPAYVLNHLFNIFSVRLQTLSYIIIFSIPFNAFNHSRYCMQIHWSTRDKENFSHSERAAYPINMCIQEKNKEMLIWKCSLFRVSAKNNWIDRACSFPYYFLPTHCQNTSV